MTHFKRQSPENNSSTLTLTAAMSPQEDLISNSGAETSDEDSRMLGSDNETNTLQETSSNKDSIHAGRNVPLVELELENVTYAPITATVGKRNQLKERKVVLSDVSTKLAPYQLSAWMGPSGSGKTSLISVAAGLIQNDDLLQSTVIKVNGEEGILPKRLVGVVWQDDLLLSNLTVEETIYFAARLKTPSSTPELQVRRVVEETMEELGLLHVRESLIGGGSRRGISGGERKRVSVASELVVRPSLLLLDEPTSGLDSTSSYSLMQTLQDLAHNGGHTVAAVIHQPRTAIFGLLDHLLLLSHGEVVFNGVPCGARAHFESCPSIQPLPSETGIADWLMDVIKEDEASENRCMPRLWRDRQSPIENNQGTTPNTNREAPTSGLERKMSSLAELHSIPKYETGFLTQLALLSKRALKQNRGEKLTKTSLILMFAYTAFTALIWWRIPDDVAHVFDRNSILFFMIIAQSNGVVTSSVTIFQQERALLHRERAKKMYGVLPYFLAKTASDMTNNVLLPCVYGAVTYWLVNLRPTGAAYILFLLAFYWTLSTAQSMGTFLSVAIPHTQISLLIAPAITLFFMIMGGFYVPFENLNPAIRWASWLSFARYGYSALLVNEFEGRGVPCSDGDVPISIGDSDECPQPGDEILASLGIEGETANYWFNIGIVVVLQFAFRTGAYALLRRRR